MQRLKRLWPWLLILIAPHVMLFPLWTDPVCVSEDDVMYYYPLRQMVGRQLRTGQWPLVNRFEGTGAPLMGDPQAAVLHPLTWLFGILSGQAAYSVSIFAAFTLAGAGAYRYLRRVGLRQTGACVGAVAFMFCGFTIGHRVHLSMLLTAAMLPWLLWAMEDLSARPLAGVLKLAPAVALTLAAGHWATAIQMAVVCVVYVAFRIRPFWHRALAGLGGVLLGMVLVAPQMFVTAEVLLRSTRQGIGYATAGENSFFPLSGVMAVLPMIFGSRTPNGLYGQAWWGPWHQCEMLGYVGLLTVALAGAAVWSLWRKRSAGSLAAPDAARLVRVWTLVAIGAGAWMLGMYLPTYRLIHLLPVLGAVRCPARMLLAMDLALAVLAAVAVDRLTRDSGESVTTLLRSVRRGVTWGMPAAVLAAWGLLSVLALAVQRYWPNQPWEMGFFVGWCTEALAAVSPRNPAVFVPILLAAATLVVARWWLARPQSLRVAGVLAVLVVDLFLVGRFVDIPADDAARQRPGWSPAGEVIHRYAGTTEGYRVFSLRNTYAERPSELLAPKTAQAMGFTTLAGYGPLQGPAPAHLFGLDGTGRTDDWEYLLRDNYLLSAYNVRFIVAADEKFHAVLRDVRAAGAYRRAPEGPDLLGVWQMAQAANDQGAVTLRAPWTYPASQVWQAVTVQPEAIYRLAFDARVPEGPAGGLQISIAEDTGTSHTTTVLPDRLGRSWRHFEHTFRTSPKTGQAAILKISTFSEKPIMLANISFRQSRWPRPLNRQGHQALEPGTRVYKVIGLADPLVPGQPKVVVYENRLCAGEPRLTDRPPDAATLEAVRRRRDKAIAPGAIRTIPRLAAERPLTDPGKILLQISIPGALLYAMVAGLAWRNQRRTERLNP